MTTFLSLALRSNLAVSSNAMKQTWTFFDGIPSLRNFAHCLVHHRTFRFENLEVLSTYGEAIQVQKRVRIIS